MEPLAIEQSGSKLTRHERGVKAKVFKRPVIQSCEEIGQGILANRAPVLPRKTKIENAELEARISRRLDLVDSYLSDNEFVGKLAQSSLSVIGIYEGIQLDKLLALRGQPSLIIGHQDQRRLDELAPALLRELNRRGLTIAPKAIDVEATLVNSGDDRRQSINVK